MKRIILFVFTFICLSVKGQVYQLMPQYGYSALRMNFDSTLTIPTFNGVPTLKSNILRKGALAIDSTNGRFYFYNPKTLAWDTIRGGGNGVPYTGATQDVDLGNNKISTKSVYITGTAGNGHLHLKHQSADATATGQSTSLYADANGDLKWKNDNQYYTTLRTQQTANRVYSFQNKTYTLADSADVAVKLNASDTSSLSNRINTKLNSSDSTIYQTKFRSDTSRTNTYTSLVAKHNLSDSVTYQTKFRSDTARTNTYTGIAGKFTLPSLTSGSVLFSNGTTIAQKNANFFWDNTNNRLGLGTTTPANALDVVRGTAGAMARGNFESGSFSFNGDAKVGVYTSSATSTDGAGIAFAQTNLQANSRYPGFELQYVYSSTVASNAIRFNYTERASTGVVQNYTANVFQALANGTVIINPTASGVTAAAKLLVGTNSSTHMLDVNGTARATQFYLSALNTAPATASSTGTTGEIRIDANFIYICTATNTWKRVAIATW